MFRKILMISAVIAAFMMMTPTNAFAENIPTESSDDSSYSGIIDDEIFDYDIVDEDVFDDTAETPTIDYHVTAEDGAEGYVRFYPDGQIMGAEIATVDPADEYDFPEYKGGTGTYYPDDEQIPLGEKQELLVVDYTVYRDDGSRVEGEKYYIIDYENKTLTYAGHCVLAYGSPKLVIDPRYPEDDASDSADGSAGTDGGLTHSPDTGSSYDFITAGAVSLAVMLLSGKRSK